MIEKLRNFSVCLFFLLFVFCLPAYASVFNAETFFLKNGMQVVVIENHRAPIVTHMVWYKVGAADERPGEIGIAHFHEHLMFRGTEDVPAYEFSKIISRNGGNDNAFTSQDFTAYHQNIAVDRLELVMKMEADRMKNLVLDEEGFKAERKVVVEERLSRYENNPSAAFSERINLALWHTHPYGKPVIGWMNDIKQLTLDDAIDFHNRWYLPNNAVLVVAGDITAEQLKPLAEKYYGVIPAGKIPERTDTSQRPVPVKTRIVMEHSQIKQPSWRRYYIVPGYNTAKGNQAYALQVLSEVLGNGNTSYLYRSLVVKHGIAAAAGSWYNPNTRGLGTFAFYLSPSVKKSIYSAEKQMALELAKFMKKGITEKTVANAKKRLLAGLIYLKDKASSGANILGKSLASGQTLEQIEDWPEKIEAVTVKDVKTVARMLFEQAPYVTGLLLPKITESRK